MTMNLAPVPLPNTSPVTCYRFSARSICGAYIRGAHVRLRKSWRSSRPLSLGNRKIVAFAGPSSTAVSISSSFASISIFYLSAMRGPPFSRRVCYFTRRVGGRGGSRATTRSSRRWAALNEDARSDQTSTRETNKKVAKINPQIYLCLGATPRTITSHTHTHTQRERDTPRGYKLCRKYDRNRFFFERRFFYAMPPCSPVDLLPRAACDYCCRRCCRCLLLRGRP